jgi:RND superfamily putative drug exporter
MLTALARLATRRARWSLAVAGLLLVAFAYWGFQAFPALISGGFDDPNAQATRAANLIDQRFGGPDNVAIVVNAPAGTTVADAAVAETGRTLTARVRATTGVTDVVSYFDVPAGADPAAADGLHSTDRTQALIVAKAPGSESAATATLKRLRTDVAGPAAAGTAGTATVWVGGAAVTGDDIGDQVLTDLARAEAIAVPITLVLLLVVFGSLVAALLPLAVGTFSVFGAFFAIWVISRFTDVSIFSINLITGLGLGLAIDYSLLIVSRFREELARHPAADRADRAAVREQVRVALTTTMQTAGRTVLFTGLAVSLALLVLLVFPIPFLRSFGYGGVAVVLVSMVGALGVLPALLVALGPRVDAGRIRRGRPVRSASTPSAFWYRVASTVLRRPWLAVPVLMVLATLASPLAHATFGAPDERTLNTQAQSRLVGDALRANFPGSTTSTPVALVSGSVGDAALRTYVREVSSLPHVDAAQSSVGVYVDGTEVAPSGPAELSDGDVHRVSVVGPKDYASADARDLLTRMRDLAPPAGTTVLVGGETAQLVDNQTALVDRLPLASGLIVLTTLVLVFLFTGSVLLPLKAVLMNVITLSAVIGAMTWIFQEGHLSGLLRFSKGPIDTSMPILLFCIAFGLSMDYELFLIARIKELHDHGHDLRESVAGGLAATGRITTMAAAVLAVTFAAFGTSRVTFIQLFGVGTGLAILLDATLVRGVLVPAFMRIAGPANWWAPAPLRALHRVIGLREATPDPGVLVPPVAAPAPRRRRADGRGAEPRHALVE